MNQSEERSRNYGEKRPLTDVSESKSVLSKKARGSGDGEVRLAANVKRKSFDDFCLNFECLFAVSYRLDWLSMANESMNRSERSRSRGEKRPSTDVSELSKKARGSGLGRMKETKLAACCPKMSTVDKLEATKVKVRVIIWKLIRY
nr:hypothetical protein [Tanacetum cinerariifolium]